MAAMVRQRFPQQADFVGRHVRDLFSLMLEELEERLAGDYPDVTAAHNRVMVMIEPEGSRPIDLARKAQVTRQSMTETLATMARLGLITLEPDPSDRRAKLAVLTPKGWTAMRDGLAAALGIHRHWEGVLGEAKMTRLMRLLRELTDGLAAERAAARARDVS
jgi:DNA-binding MarR family transcriptional regulator